MSWRKKKDQAIHGLGEHRKELTVYSEDNREILNDFRKRNEIIRFTVKKVHSISVYIDSIFCWHFSDLVLFTGTPGNFLLHSGHCV